MGSENKIKFAVVGAGEVSRMIKLDVTPVSVAGPEYGRARVCPDGTLNVNPSNAFALQGSISVIASCLISKKY